MVIGFNVTSDGGLADIELLSQLRRADPSHGALDNPQPTIPFGLLGGSDFHLKFTDGIFLSGYGENHWFLFVGFYWLNFWPTRITHPSQNV